MRAHEQAAVPSLLLFARLIDRHGRRRNDIFIIEIGYHGNDSPWLGADADKLHHAVGPPQLTVHRVLSRRGRLCKALWDNDHPFGSLHVPVVEVAALLNRHTEGVEEARRYH